MSSVRSPVTRGRKTAFSEKLDGQVRATHFQFFQKVGTDSSGRMMTFRALILTHAGPDERENLVHGDRVPFHARDFRDGGDFPLSPRQARSLNDHVDAGGNQFSNGPSGKVHAGQG